MRKNWKRLSVMGMAVLIGCLMPVGTMMAAEENMEAVQTAGSVSDNTLSDDNKDNPDDKLNAGSGENVDNVANDSGTGAEDYAKLDGADADNDVKTDGEGTAESIDGEANADDEISGTLAAMPAVELTTTVSGVTTPQSVGAPVIDIKWQGQSRTYGLGGKIEYEYVNNYYQSMIFSAAQGGQAVSLYYYQDKVKDMTAAAKEEEQMASLAWQTADGSSLTFISDGNYVVYVKAEGADGQVAYARSGGIVVDTEAPKITGVQDGNAYPEGTSFYVQDPNLESVTINEKPVALSPDGKYQIAASGVSCVIKAKDKAGNNVTYSITVSGRDPAQDGNVISKSGIYALKEGVSYKLSEGRWSIVGDRTVYAGENDFYIKRNGDYTFVKY